jgi:hypothetical protein
MDKAKHHTAPHSEGILAEFENPAALLEAAAKVRDAGYKRWEVYSPFPIHGMDDAMGLKPSILGWVVGLMAFVGLAFAVWLQWWTQAVDYPIVISGKPFFSIAYVPVTFELTVLFSALTAVFGMFVINRMPRYFHPVFYSDRFVKVTDNGFFIAVFAWDKKYNDAETKAFFETIGGKQIEILMDEGDVHHPHTPEQHATTKTEETIPA